jgi:hypothetical protein
MRIHLERDCGVGLSFRSSVQLEPARIGHQLHEPICDGLNLFGLRTTHGDQRAIRNLHHARRGLAHVGRLR